jgi:hypothetical protein
MEEGNRLKKAGMQLSLFNAEINDPGWKDKALVSLTKFIFKFPDLQFQTEDVRAWAYRNGLPEPPNHRAWGGIISSAKRKGIIAFVGYENVDNPNAHCTPAAVWKGR